MFMLSAEMCGSSCKTPGLQRRDCKLPFPDPQPSRREVMSCALLPGVCGCVCVLYRGCQAHSLSSPDALPAAPLIIAGASTAQAASFLLVPGAERLAAESQVLVFDVSGLTPGVEGLDVGEVVVVAVGSSSSS
jgi:hypothetical protein